PHHVGLDVARLPVFPGHQHPLSVLNHHICISGDAVAMERRLSQLALGAPEIALAGQEALAKGSPCTAQPVMFDELAVLGNQHLLDQVGMVEEENRSGPESRPDQVAVLAMPARERPQTVAAEFPQVSGEPVLPGAGRTLYLRSRACLRTHADILENLALKHPCGRCGIDNRNSPEYNGPLSGPPGNTGQVVSSPPRARRAPGGVLRGILR